MIEYIMAYGLGVVSAVVVFIIATYRRDQLIRQGRYIVVDGSKPKLNASGLKR